MMTNRPNSKRYTISEAARLLGISEDELRCAIKDGLLRAELQQNTGEYQVAAADVAEYSRLAHRAAPPMGSRKARILIIDDEINFANILKIELQRDPRLEVRFATWGRDGVVLAERTQPDVLLVDFMLPDITGEEVLKALARQRKLYNTRILVYSAHTAEALRQHPHLQARLGELGADAFISKENGMRAIVVACYEMLGLDTNTKILKRAF